MKRLAVLGAVAVAAIACTPALASEDEPPVRVFTTGSCSTKHPNELASVGNVYVCSRAVSVQPEAEIHSDGSPCPAGWTQAGLAGTFRVCVTT